MELLTRPSMKDRLHYAIAFLSVCLCGGLALLPVYQIRVLIRALCILGGCSPSAARLFDRISWVVLGVAWATYILIIEPLYTSGVTEGRVWRAQERPIPPEIAASRVKRALWEWDLYHTTVRFLKSFWIPLVIYGVALGLTELVMALSALRW